MAEATKKHKYPGTFWTANVVEFFERAAYYAMFISITLYLSRVVGYSDVNAAWIGGVFSAGLYFLPTFAGALADKMGFRPAVILAFSFLSVGYFTLAALPTKGTVMIALLIVMIGGSFIKSIITGTVAKSSTKETRAKAYSIFYAVVNIGAFIGKTIAYPVRLEWGLTAINYYAAGLSFVALIAVFFFYKSINTEGEGKTLAQVGESFLKVVSNVRLLFLIIIITGFWIIQHQLYATMPKFILRTVGETASPEWIANVNPFVVMTMVFVVTAMMKRYRAISSMNVGMLLMPLSALVMSGGPILQSWTGLEVGWLLNLHPYVVMMIFGIVFQGLAECFISPRYLEYFSLQAPKGEEGLYLGFSHLHSFLSSILGFGISGYLLEAYCPDPTLPQYQNIPPEILYQDAHMIWYYFAAIGLSAAIALFIYGKIVDHYDKRKALRDRESGAGNIAPDPIK